MTTDKIFLKLTCSDTQKPTYVRLDQVIRVTPDPYGGTLVDCGSVAVEVDEHPDEVMETIQRALVAVEGSSR